MASEPTLGKVWTLTLPSGAGRVKAKRTSVLSLIWAGGFPNEVTALMWRMVSEDKGAARDEQQRISDEDFRSMAGLIERYVPTLLVDPKVGPETTLTQDSDSFLHGTVRMDDLEDMDKQYLFFFGRKMLLADEEPGFGPQEAAPEGVKNFPAGPDPTDAGHAGEAVRPAPVEPRGDPAGGAPGA